ncbi:MAG TPA: SPFH domain-containing protein [Anaerolineales bacterium]|nr:SPFH domain-containing protein [Anaerolineales bacterium]
MKRLWQLFSDFLQGMFSWLIPTKADRDKRNIFRQKYLADFLEVTLSRRNAKIRGRLLVGLFLAYWVLIAFSETAPSLPFIIDGASNIAGTLLPGEALLPYRQTLQDALSFIGNSLIARFFTFHTLRHLPIVLAVFAFLVYRATQYVQDLFELDDPSAARAYLESAVMGWNPQTMEISEGKIRSDHLKTPVALIGGPGRVQVHMGNLAVFERLDGSIQVYDNRKAYMLEGFERLREVLDLRDLRRTIENQDFVTADGIRMTATELVVDFRISTHYRRRVKRTSQNPYPYNPEAALAVVYGLAVNEKGETDWAKAIAGFVGGVVASYFGRFTSFELLSMDFHKAQRNVLSELFYEAEMQAKLRKLGAEIEWVGVGTIKPNDQAIGSLLERTRKEWQETFQNIHTDKGKEAGKASQGQAADFLGEIIRWYDGQQDPKTPVKPIPIINLYYQALQTQMKRQYGDDPSKWDATRAETLQFLRDMSRPNILGSG